MPARFTKVKVVLRGDDRERAWMVEVDGSATLPELLPDLVETLPVEGEPDEFELHSEGSLQKPILVLSKKKPKRVGGYEDLNE